MVPYRQQNLDDVNWGLTVLANGIKFVSAILTVLGGDTTDRSEYDETMIFTLVGNSENFLAIFFCVHGNYIVNLADFLYYSLFYEIFKAILK